MMRSRKAASIYALLPAQLGCVELYISDYMKLQNLYYLKQITQEVFYEALQLAAF